MNNIVQKQKKHLTGQLLALLMLLFAFTGTMKADELTVYEGTTLSYYAPAYIFYFDAVTRCQYVIPAEDLSEMAGGTISSLTYYTNLTSAYTTVASANVYVKEVDYTSISAYEDVSTATLVYSGYFNIDASGVMSITFNDSYVYGGGNLLIAVENPQSGNYKSVKFYGQTVTGACICASASSLSAVAATQRNFIPKTTFEYVPGGDGALMATPDVLDLGNRPNGYESEPAMFELSCRGNDTLIVSSMVVDNDYFQLGVPAPFTVDRNNPVTVNVTTGVGDPGTQNGLVTITYGESETVTVSLTANAYDVVSPDIWQLAEEVTEFPFNTVTETDNLYHNYDIPGSLAEGRDAVYKVTFTEDVMFSAGTDGDNAATMIYPEDFYGEDGPGLDNYYYYDGPQVNPGPINYWFSYAYTGSNTFFGYSAGGGMIFGYRITAEMLQELGLGNCAITTVEAAAREGSYYNLVILKGGDTPDLNNMVYYQEFDNYEPFYFFDLNLDEPQFLGDDENIWVMFYSDSPYAAYSGKQPVDAANSKIWYTTDLSTWYSNTTYTPLIYTRFIELPTGREVTVNLADMKIRESKPAEGQIAEANGDVMGVSMAQHYMEAKAQNNRDGETYQIEDLYVPAGTYYVVVSSTSEDFEVNMTIDEVPNPMQAEVYAPYEGENDVVAPYYAEWSLGYYTKEMQVLCGTTNPPATALIDWTDYLVESAFISSFVNNRAYYFQVNERNNTGVTEGEIIRFTTPLDKVQGVDGPSYVYTDGTVTLSWDAIEDEELLGYNVYMDGILVNDTLTLITDTNYQLGPLEYNPTGYNFNVTAVYEAGESEFSTTHVVCVLGYGNITGYVYEQDGVTPIEGVEVSFYGVYELDQTYGFSAYTDEEGYYNVQLGEGYYDDIYASKEGYQITYLTEGYYLEYQGLIEGVNFNLDEEFYGVDYVNATETSVPKITWGYNENGGDRSFKNYRVYRTLFDNDGPFNVNNTVFIGEVANESYIYDETFGEVEDGLYKYGVGVVYEGNRDGALSEFTETFDDGLPETWSMIDADYDGRCWMLGSEASLGFGHGHNGSNDMMISKSFENGSSVYPDNYLVSPQVTFGKQSIFEFYACAQDENYPSEYFGVAVSTGSNDNQYDFEMVAEWQMEAKGQGNWYKYIVELNQYAGQTGYIAIRHFNSGNQFYLDIDDVAFYNIDIQVARESAITWSNVVGKGMYLTDGEVNITVTLNSGDAPEGITATFKNLTQPEIEDIVVNLDENGYYSFDSIRKGVYEITLEKTDYYVHTEQVEILEPASLEFVMYETLYAPKNLKVSHSGYATWDAPQSPDRHLVDDLYNIYLYDEDGESLLWYTTLYENHGYIPEDMMMDGEMYVTKVRAYYSGTNGGVIPSELATCTWEYMSCDHFDGATNIKAKPMDEGVYMTWEYPVADTVQVLGANVYVYDEYFGFTEGNEWMFEGYNEYNSFSIRVVYENYDISCMQYAEIINRYWIYTDVYYGSGYVTESAMYYKGDTCVLTATPSDNYDFYSWLDGWYGGTVSYEPTYSFVVEREGYYGARFITDHYWNDVNQYENNMGVIGIIKIEDEEVDGIDAPLVEVGAFCNGECRGHHRLHYYPQVDRYLVYLTVYGDEGDNIDFRLSVDGYEQSMMCTSSIVFEADAVLGTPFEPYEFNFYETFWNEQYDELNAGWNWWSTFIEQGGSYNGLSDLQAYLTNSGYMISSQTEFTMNYGAYGWYGSLNSINNESMYKIKMNEPGYSYLYYYNARTDRHPITVVPGWNYIGYVSNNIMDLEDALIGIEPSNGDMIKSQYAYANYYEGYGWFGSLNYMEPGMGYMYKAADTATFVYGEATRGITKENLTAENNHWVPNTNAYRDNMTVMAVVNMNGVELASDNYELAAFADGECRGSVTLIYSEPLNRYVAFLTVAGEEKATLRFGLYDAATGAELYSDDNMMFNADVVAGNPGEPVVISFSGMNDSNSFMVYPNPVANGERVNIVLSGDSQRTQVDVLNTVGEVVSTEIISGSQASIALPAVPGVYTVRIITDNNDTNFRKVIVK